MGASIILHFTLMMIALLKHTQFAGPGRTERNVVGTRLWPGYALRSLGLMAVAMLVPLPLGARALLSAEETRIGEWVDAPEARQLIMDSIDRATLKTKTEKYDQEQAK